MMEVTNSVSTQEYLKKRDRETVKIQFIPQIVSTLRRELIFWEDQPIQLDGKESFL